MARPRSHVVQYFPHDCQEQGQAMFIVEQRFGNDGYAFVYKLKEILGGTQGHVVDLTKDETFEFLQAKTRLLAEKCIAILDLLAKLDVIDRALWTERRIVWMQDFVDGIADVYRKRKTEIPQRPSFCDRNPGTDQVSVTETPQSKINQNKKKKKTFTSDSDEFRLAELLLNLILSRKPDLKKPDLQSWAKDFDLLLRADKRPIEKVKKLIRWVQADSFEQNNVMCPEKLRMRYDHLELKMNKVDGKNKPLDAAGRELTYV